MYVNYSKQIKLSFAMLLLFVGLFLMGTFCDKTAAELFYSPDNTLAKLVTSIGTYPFYSVQVLFLGALFERIVHSERRKSAKIILCAVCAYAALTIGYVCSRSLMSSNNLGGIFPSVVRNNYMTTAVSVIFEYPLFGAGYFLAGRTSDELLVKRILGLLSVFLTAFMIMQILKNCFDRPRYRTVVHGYEGVTFVPWYKPFNGAGKYALKYHINADEFRSFPSGHSIMSVLNICILPSLVWLFPEQKGKQLHLFAVGAVFGVIVMLTRMILGAHYLSDVSAGASIGVIAAIVFSFIQIRISSESRKK